MTALSNDKRENSVIEKFNLLGRTTLGTGPASLTLAFALLATAAAAQNTTATQTAAASEASAENDVIVVTGSRIARPELEAASPTAILSAASIQQTGAANVQDVLAELPSVGQNISRSSSNFSTTGNGVATVNLRNLGSSRTLVLINNRRSVGIAGTSSVDINNIPTDLIDRVEVVTEGASAVYGSDAVAGVVNFVLNDKFDGLRIRGQGTISDKGDAARQYVSVTGGQSFGGDKGHIVGNFSYDKDHGLRSANRSFSAKDNPNRSSYASQGLFSTDGNFSTNGNTFTFAPDNTVKGYQGANTDGYNRNGDRYLSLPVERFSGTVLGNYEFADYAQVYVEGEYTKTKSNAGLEPSAIANSGPGAALNFDGSAYDGIPITSPYVPTAIRDAAIAQGVDVLQFRRRSNDIFSRSNKNDRDFYRGVIGLKGDLSSTWHYDASFEHSQTRDHTSSQAIYTPNYGAALSNQLDASGNVECSDAAARAAGCVPVNIFGFNTVSSAAAAFLQTYTGPTQDVLAPDGKTTVHLTNGANVSFDYLAKVRQDVAALNFTGQLFNLPGGPVGVAFGGEYRREKSTEIFDPFTQLGLSSGNQISNTAGKFNVKEGYIEVHAPILKDRPFVYALNLDGAFRYADYSTVGGVKSYKGSAEYAPIRDIRFRGVYARAVRAPNIGELFSSTSQTFPAVLDPCDQRGGAGDDGAIGALPASCAAIPGVAATIAKNGNFSYSTAQIQTIDGLTGGNINLKAEKADTITAGVVLAPSFIRNFTITADYYRIKVKNAIGIIGQQISVSQCFATANPIFCNNVIRDPGTGFITRVNALNLNTGSYLVAGVDVEARYLMDLSSVMRDSAINLDVRWNHRFKQQQTPYPGGDVQNEIGEADCYSCGRLGSGFRDRVYTSATVTKGAFSLNYRLDYLGPLVDNLDGSVQVPTRIRPFFYHNFQATVDVGPSKNFEFYLGVNNAFDKKPPIFADTNPVTFPGTQTVADTYDTYGRMLYAGATVKF